MKRPDYDFVRQALRNLDKPSRPKRNPLLKKLMLQSLHAPVISLWEKPFEQTEPAMWKDRREEYTEQDQYELTTSWLYNDFVFLAQDKWAGYDLGENGLPLSTGPTRVWTYFIKNQTEYPLHEALVKDTLASSLMQSWLPKEDAPISDVYVSNPDHYYFALCAISNFVDGKWESPVTLGINWFWFPDPSDEMYSTTPEGDVKWMFANTKSTEDYFEALQMDIREDEKEELTRVAPKQLAKAVDLHGYLKYGDRHAVEVLPSADKLTKAKQNPANRTRPWNTASGPHVLLLDRMPGTQREGLGTHASPRPHRRRGHWKTLQHPRFRHHPQYQKKIYCKPSFVGPRQTNYDGNIYRLVQPIDEMEATA